METLKVLADKILSKVSLEEYNVSLIKQWAVFNHKDNLVFDKQIEEFIKYYCNLFNLENLVSSPSNEEKH